MITTRSFTRRATKAAVVALAGLAATLIGCAGNNPPNTPSNPVPSDGATGQPLGLTLAWTGGDADGDTVTYTLYFGTTPNPPQRAVGLDSSAYAVSDLALNGTYYWQVKAEDQHGAVTDGPVWNFRTAVNHPPAVPSIPAGPARGWWGTPYRFVTAATDPEADSVAYQFDWGDGTVGEWSDFFASGIADSAAHAYSSTGTFEIKARAKDTKGAQSEWSRADSIAITVGIRSR